LTGLIVSSPVRLPSSKMAKRAWALL
jgi:hypothetical protein